MGNPSEVLHCRLGSLVCRRSKMRARSSMQWIGRGGLVVTRVLLGLFTAVVALLAGDVPSQPAAPGATIETLTLAGGIHLRIITNVSLASGSATVDRAVVVIHGTLRNASDYYSRMAAAA